MSQLKEITFQQYKDADKIMYAYEKQEYDKTEDNVKNINNELSSYFKKKKIDGMPVLIWLTRELDTYKGGMKYQVNTNIEEDFDHNWWDIITPILNKYGITKYTKENKYM